MTASARRVGVPQRVVPLAGDIGAGLDELRRVPKRSVWVGARTERERRAAQSPPSQA